MSSPLACHARSSWLSERCLDECKAARVERGCGLVFHLVAGNLEHFFLQAHRVPSGAGFLLARPVDWKLRRSCKTRDMEDTRARERNLGSSGAARLEFERAQIARLEAGCIGVSDVLGEQTLALLVPLHLRPHIENSGMLEIGIAPPR